MLDSARSDWVPPTQFALVGKANGLPSESSCISSLRAAVASGVLLACVGTYAKECYIECTMYNDMKYKCKNVKHSVKVPYHRILLILTVNPSLFLSIVPDCRRSALGLFMLYV
jgi:hypothetical protein